jgi:hypothetical protein
MRIVAIFVARFGLFITKEGIRFKPETVSAAVKGNYSFFHSPLSLIEMGRRKK